MAKTDYSEAPAFEIHQKEGEDGPLVLTHAIYADGRITGFRDGAVVVNRILSREAVARAQGMIDGRRGIVPPGVITEPTPSEPQWPSGHINSPEYRAEQAQKNADARAMLDCAGQRKIEFDIMYNEFEEWKKTHEAFECVQASDFKEVWMTAYRAGMKAKQANSERLMLLLAHAVKEADGWHDDGHGGPVEDDPLMDEARALVDGMVPAPTLERK